MRTQVGPRADAVEGQDYAVHRELLARLGADGYVGVEVPEAHGGAGLDTVTSVIVSESLSSADSFAVTYLAHAGIGTLPLVFFGTEEQRARYLPGLAAGTTVGAYALTEPGSGSDARAMRTTATPLPDGGYRLDGTKQFITNAGFADLFTLYARLEDGGIAAFLVERDRAGPDGRRRGAQDGHQRQLHLPGGPDDGVEVPADALLGEPGEGHKIAFNILNVGRFKLAAAALGGMKRSLGQALDYASEREAFGRPIVGFPLMAAKLAGMATRTYAVESVTYRIAGMLDARLEAASEGAGSEAFRAALEEYAVECSIAKVLGSEELDWTVDQLVQVHGGYGYTAEFPAERGLPRRPHQPHLGGDQRDQPAARDGHARQAGDAGPARPARPRQARGRRAARRGRRRAGRRAAGGGGRPGGGRAHGRAALRRRRLPALRHRARGASRRCSPTSPT